MTEAQAKWFEIQVEEFNRRISVVESEYTKLRDSYRWMTTKADRVTLELQQARKLLKDRARELHAKELKARHSRDEARAETARLRAEWEGLLKLLGMFEPQGDVSVLSARAASKIVSLERDRDHAKQELFEWKEGFNLSEIG